jgi:hypothetical protein
MIGACAVSLLTISVVLCRLKRLPPLEDQRMRLVLGGCLIGIAAFIFSDSNEATSFWAQNIWSLATLHRWTPSRHEPDRIVIKGRIGDGKPLGLLLPLTLEFAAGGAGFRSMA